MKFIKNEYPYFDLSDKFKNLNSITTDKYKKTIFTLFLILFYSLCFGLGMMMFNYHSKFVSSAFYFLFFLIVSSIIIVPIHLLLHALALPGQYSNNDIYVGFNKSLLNFFVLYNKPMSKKRLIFSTLLPFIFITASTLGTLLFIYKNMFVYALFCFNILLSVFDLYDAYILIFKDKGEKDKSNRYIKVENSIYKTTI